MKIISDMQKQINLIPEVQKEVKDMKEFMKKHINRNFLEEEQIIYVKFVNKTNGSTIIVDTVAPLGEFRKYKIEEFLSKLELKKEFAPTYSL